MIANTNCSASRSRMSFSNKEWTAGESRSWVDLRAIVRYEKSNLTWLHAVWLHLYNILQTIKLKNRSVVARGQVGGAEVLAAMEVRQGILVMLPSSCLFLLLKLSTCDWPSLLFLFNWSTVDFQYCVHFWHTGNDPVMLTTYMYPFPILSHYGLLQDTEFSSWPTKQ